MPNFLPPHKPLLTEILLVLIPIVIPLNDSAARSSALISQDASPSTNNSSANPTKKTPPPAKVLDQAIWTIPDQRMKTGKEHRVPLSHQAIEVLKKVEALKKDKDSFIFPSIKTGKALSDVALSKALHNAANTKEVTIHGLRSTFRDWCGEATSWPRDVAEMALAHTIATAYRRGDLFAKRRDMMQQWGEYCYQGI